MKKILNIWLMAALVCSLSLSVTSCKDDDDDKSEQQIAAEQAEQASQFWTVVGSLVGTEQYTADYEGKTFAPTIGTPSERNATVREVLTNDMATAALRFNDLVGLSAGEGAIDETTQTYTWSDPAVGTLTYNKTQDGTSLATVDVSIKQVPQLRQIVYLTAEQQGKNGDFPGTAWYRFGDVISKPNADGNMEYWVCVRPAMGKEDKDVSHWITVSPLPRKNIYSYHGSNNIDYELPTGLKVSTEHMNNLSEMLYAIVHPVTWQQNITNHFGDGLKIFHDFHADKVKYHNQYFWMRVAKAWKDSKNNICQTLFGLTFEQMTQLIDRNALYYLSYGYSWPWGNSPTLYQYRYFNGTKPSELNMHKKEEKKKITKNVIANNITLNLQQYNLAHPYWICGDFFGDDDPRFIVRVAKGSELMGSDAGVYQTMNHVNNITDVYTYNNYYNITPGKETDPEQANEAMVNDAIVSVGNVIGADGNFYATKALAETKGGGALAIVAALGDKKHPFEKGTQYNGLAFALPERGYFISDKISTEENLDCGLQKHTTHAEYLSELNGLAVTSRMADGCGKGHSHPAAVSMRDYKKQFTTVGKARHNFSNWFIPSFGQYLRAVEGLGFTICTEDGKDYKSTQELSKQSALKIFETAGLNYSGNLSTLTCSLAPNTAEGLQTVVSASWYTPFLKKDAYLAEGIIATEVIIPFILFEY
ncbi:MAG: hypothetical protein J6Y33_05185 [Prevotella sp.]|nr:hypothetical protein [Prevotella sp.]